MLGKVNSILQRIQQQIPGCANRAQAAWYLLDFAAARLRYHVMFEEYRQYQFYRLKNRARREYVTEYEVLNVLPRKFNHPQSSKILDDKLQFNRYFKDCVGRDYCCLDGCNEAEFAAFVKKHPSFILKPTDSWCGHGVMKMDCGAETDIAELYAQLRKDYGACLVEEIIVQHEKMASLNPDSVNTIRVISLLDAKGEVHIPCAAVRIGRSGACIDNFCSGGMAAAVDAASGMIISGAFDRNSDRYLVHPDTGTGIVGFQIPEWDRVVDAVKAAARRLPDVRFVGWDVVVQRNGTVCFVEGNSNPGARTIQMPLKQGLKPAYVSVLGRF